MATRYKYIDENKEHLHTLDGKPLIGTSTATKIIAKPLTWWASGMAVAKFGWLNPKKNKPEECERAAREGYSRVLGLGFEDYVKLLKDAYKAHNDRKEQAAEDGSDRHEILEAYVKHCLSSGGNVYVPGTTASDPAIQAFIEWAQQNVKRFLWSELHCYSEKLWTGGIGDVGWEDLEGRIVAGDFKSGGPYFDQFIQVAGYDIEISENGGFDKDGNKLFTLERPIDGYCVIPFNDFKPTFVWDVASYQEAFRSAVKLTKVQNSYADVAIEG